MKTSTRLFIGAGASAVSTYLHHLAGAILLANGEPIYAAWADRVALFGMLSTLVFALVGAITSGDG